LKRIVTLHDSPPDSPPDSPEERFTVDGRLWHVMIHEMATRHRSPCSCAPRTSSRLLLTCCFTCHPLDRVRPLYHASSHALRREVATCNSRLRHPPSGRFTRSSKAMSRARGLTFRICAVVTSLEPRGTVPCRSSFARKRRPLVRADRFQSWDARRSLRRSAACPPNRWAFPRPSLESFEIH
jgi:hypothetical protein